MTERTPFNGFDESDGFANAMVPNPGYTDLCPMAETYLDLAIQDDAFVVVNGIAVKVIGKVAGLVTSEQEVQGGTLKLNHWYGIDHGFDNPYKDHHRKAAILAAFESGETHLTLPGVTRWFEYRAVRTDEVMCLGLSHEQDLVRAVSGSVTRLRPNRTTVGNFDITEYVKRIRAQAGVHSVR